MVCCCKSPPGSVSAMTVMLRGSAGLSVITLMVSCRHANVDGNQLVALRDAGCIPHRTFCVGPFGPGSDCSAQGHFVAFCDDAQVACVDGGAAVESGLDLALDFAL